MDCIKKRVEISNCDGKKIDEAVYSKCPSIRSFLRDQSEVDYLSSVYSQYTKASLTKDG